MSEGCPPTTSRKMKAPEREMVTKPLFHDPKLGWKKVTLAEFFKRRKEISKRVARCREPEHIAKCALSDYNKKHGTHLEFVRFLDGRVNLSFYGGGYCIDFVERSKLWTHLNFEARPYNADPVDESLLLFAEVYTTSPLAACLTTLSLVDPADKSNGCQVCSDNIFHPRNGFRADVSTAVDKHVLPQADASNFSKLALELYNNQNGTNLVFISALQCNKFTSVGLLMDFTQKVTIWMHMNFKARVGGPKGDELRLFAELYLGGDDKYVLATLSATQPTEMFPRENRKKKMLGIQRGCCPDRIYHPWRGFHYGFNSPPGTNFLPPVEVAACESEPYAAE